MSQQINLYHDRFRPVIDPISATRLVGLVFASLVVLGATWSWSSWRLSESRAEASRMRGVLEGRRTELADLARSAGARRADPQLEEALARAEALYRARTELMALLDSGALGAVEGFSGQMRALARQSATGLWLTGFDLSPGRVELQGGALSAELVPAYLRRLAGEKAMEGSIPLSTLRAKVDYGFSEASTPQGNIGIKVWVNNGDFVTGEINDATDASAGGQRKSTRRRRGS